MGHQCRLFRTPETDCVVYSFCVFRELEEPEFTEEIASWDFRLDENGSFVPDQCEVYLKRDHITLSELFERLKDYKGIEPYVKVAIAGVAKHALLVAHETTYNLEYYRFPSSETERRELSEARKTVDGKNLIEHIVAIRSLMQVLRYLRP